MSLEAVTLLSEGRIIDAIKAVRTAEGLGLKEAKNRIDAHIAQDPLLRVQIETQRRAVRRKIFFWFLAIDTAIVAAAIYWYSQRGPA